MIKINIDMPKSCESCPLLCEDDNLDYCCCVDNSIDVDCEARAENCPLTPLEEQPNRCDSCKHSEECDGSNCYECVKGMADNFEAQPTKMRDATEEERKSVKDYVDSVSKPTGVNFNELLRDCGTCKHNTGIDCGQYPCNECNRRTHPLYEPKIAQPTEAVSREQALLALTGMDLPTDRDKLIALFTERIQHLPPVTPTSEDIKEAYLKGYDYGVKDWFKDKTQPTDADCISREAVIRLVEQYPHIITNRFNGLIAEIKDLPPVTPQIETCEDCISREVMLSLQTEYAEKIGATTFWKLRDDIRELPSVKPKYTDEEIDKAQAVEQAYVDKMVELAVEELKRPKGKWLARGVGFTPYECSECEAVEFKKSNYCPNCGAEMSGGGAEMNGDGKE